MTLLQRCSVWLSSRIPGIGATAIQSDHGYSVDRLFAFHEYCQSASRWRVALVLLLYSVPALALLLILDWIPLQDPREAWSTNTVYWARIAVMTLVITAMVLRQGQLVLPGVGLTTKKIVAIVIGTTIGYTGTLMLLANYWMFPIPFALTLGGVIFAFYLNLFGTIALSVSDRANLQRFYNYTLQVGVQASMGGVYPVYNAIFLTLDGVAQLAFVLLLPVIKLTFKYVISKTQPSQSEFTIATSSGVDIFDALYMSKCMQSCGTLAVGFGVVFVDLAQNYVAICSLSRQSHILQPKYTRDHNNRFDTTKLLPFACELLEKTKWLDSPQALRFSASDRFQISVTSQGEINRLQSLRAPEIGVAAHEADVLSTKRSMQSVAPFQPINVWRSSSSNSESRVNSTSIVRDVSRQLHMSEKVAIVEYVETVAPVFYALYLVIVFHLPNAKYYHDMANLTEAKMHNVVINIMIYAVLELLSMVYVHLMIKHHFGVSVFCQVAFSLESEWRVYQCYFFIWTLIVFQYLLIHN
uniref:Uncharacterized protein n=1 Tax=Globisporangium ultimum (strain ATCC 200006 / CBS 805.95 / DAOM BR144) TaxID=431595 RepID=K3W6Z6_GLOUD